MEVLKYLILGLLGITAFAIFIIAIKSKKPLKFLFFNSLVGIGILFVLYFTKKYTGTYLPINQYTLIGSAVFGIPAIIGFLILNILLM